MHNHCPIQSPSEIAAAREKNGREAAGRSREAENHFAEVDYRRGSSAVGDKALTAGRRGRGGNGGGGRGEGAIAAFRKNLRHSLGMWYVVY
jgi:phage tail tape-measure protein